MAAQHQFEITQHLLRIIGICADCQHARQQSERNLTVSLGFAEVSGFTLTKQIKTGWRLR